MDLNSSRKMIKEDSAPTLPKTDTSDERKEKAKDLVMMKTFPKHGLPLEAKIEQMERRKYVLIRKYNWLTSAVREREDRLTNLLKLINCQPGDEGCNESDKNYQHIVQMENDQEKVKMKTKEAKEIQTFYHTIWEHLKQEHFVLENLCEQKKHELVIGPKAIEKAKKKHKRAQFDSSTAESQRVHMEHMVLEKRRNMDDELQKLYYEKEYLKIHLETSQQAKLKKLQIIRKGKTVSEEDVRKAAIMAELDTLIRKLKDSRKHVVRWFRLKEDTMSEMSQEVNRVQLQQHDVEKARDLLATLKLVEHHYSFLKKSGLF